MVISFVWLVVLVGAFAAIVRGISTSIGPVSRERVAKFARRQTLFITPDNGNIVITY
ncbi:MAG: hypothetical protein QOG52_1812, partial [Frankiaceae bacterium]|nr:hypothetical protein [Frankiaceae bacterium]